MENPWQTRCGSFWHSPSHDSHTQDSMLLTNGIIQDPMLSNEHGLDNLAHANFGASFLSLVSGTTSHVACDVQYLLDPKPVSAANLASSNRRTANAFDGGTRVSILPSALWPSNWNCLNLTSGDSFSSFTSSHTNVNCSYSSAHLNFQKSRDVVCHNNHEINKANLVSSLIGNNNASPLSTDSWKLPKSAHTSFLQEIPIESNVSSYHHGCNSSSSSLRVFCLGMSGNLLLSDTGLLGVVCACHGLYMSISKFSEHSGSCDVNPGDAVRMENGESLAHWLKTFSRTGIRVLEGQRGWDWPDGISVAAGFANHHTASMLSLQQQNYSGMDSKENQILRNSVDEYPFYEQVRTSQGCSNSISKFFTDISHRNLQHSAGQHMYGVPKSNYLHTEKASLSTTGKFDSSVERAISLPSSPNIQEKPEQSWSLETKLQHSFGSVLNGMHEEPSKGFLPDKIIQKTSNGLQSSGLTLQYDDITFNPIERRESIQLERNMGGAHCAKTNFQEDPSNVSLKMANVNSLLLSYLKHPSTKSLFRNIYDNSCNGHLDEKLYCESHALESEKICPSWSSVGANMKEFVTKVSNGEINVIRGKEVECSLNALLGADKSNTEFSKQIKGNLSNFNLVAGESSSNYSPASCENSQQMPAMVADESFGRAIFKNCSIICPLTDVVHSDNDRVKAIQNSMISKVKTPMSLSSKSSVLSQNAIPTLSKENSCGINKGLQYENMDMAGAALWNTLELPKRDKAPLSSRCNNSCVQSLLTVSSSPSKEQTNLLDSLRVAILPKVGEKPMLSENICQMGQNIESFAPTTAMKCRPRGTKCNFSLSKKEHCYQGLPNAYVPKKCSSAAEESHLTGKRHLNAANCDLVKQEIKIGSTSLLHSKLEENCISLEEHAKFFESNVHLASGNIKKAESCCLLWRDVPKRKLQSSDSSGKELGGTCIQPLSHDADVAKSLVGFARRAVPFKGQEISNISSGCFTPNVSQLSIELNNNDSSTVEGENIKHANYLALDEGSGINRSWSSDDALDNDFCAGFFGSTSSINLIKREPTKVVSRKEPLSLIEQIRLQNPSYRLKRSSTIQEDTDYFLKFELGPKKRRKTVKWMKLDITAPLSCQSSIYNGSSKCSGEVGKNDHSFWETQMSIGCHHGCPRNCADSIEQSVRQRDPAFSAAKKISLRKNLQKVYHQGEQQTTEVHKSSAVNGASKYTAIFRKKKLRLDDASASGKEIREICSDSAELAVKLTSLLGKTNFYKRMAKPTVFGKYGVISNGNPLKPTKIIPLKVILKTAVSLSDIGNKNADDCEKLKSAYVKVKHMSGGEHTKEKSPSEKFLKDQVKNGGTDNSQHFDPECREWNGDIEAVSCAAANGSDDLSYTSQKRNAETKSGFQLKTKFKEVRKRSLHELLTKGNSFRAANVSKSPLSICQTASRCGELMEKAVHGRARTHEMNNSMRFSEKRQSENSDMFCCVSGGDPDKDEYNRLLQCSRFLIKQMSTDKGIPPLEGVKCNSDSENQPGEKFLTCARTEAYNGRKQGRFMHNHTQNKDGNDGCLVPQEQLNAWLHIHRQKPQSKGRPKLSCSNIESDCRKAYARYKQSKSWEHLVVYKSGIHALGLYTSRFISRGAMVVEYVGEIVGLRVADRREKEYHSGKKLLHKSACYFFRIDKEHIIDATRKGGIARFVNHSCQPNCAAKVISIRAEKKVVFFAERDVYPGEEITYDYHFNHEDDGEKIPCYCKSKNCRRYLN